MYAKVQSLGLFGLNAFSVDAEIDISRGSPKFEIVGLPDASVKESREPLPPAVRSCSIDFPIASVMVNLAPADTKKSGSIYDMAIFMALVTAMRYIEPIGEKSAFIGELSLSGDVRPINGVLPMVMLAREKGIKEIFVPAENAAEASVLSGISVFPVKNAEQLIRHFKGVEKIPPAPRYIPPEADYNESLDFSDVRGQQFAKRALEIAAAGGHNALLIGSPGSGKSMLAKRISSILPPLTFEEALETTKIHSISGLLDPKTPIITKRPFRSPHHTISSAGLTGGGSVPKPGEVSLAHNGLLFLDELAEFDKHTLEVLRQPLEDGQVTISRVSGSVTYPCTIMIIGAMNPCPCGYYGHPTRKCICSENTVKRYQSKISGPLLERIDLHIEVAPVEFADLSSKAKEESSAEIRKRGIAARKIQTERFKGTPITCNALITADKLQKFCPMDDEALNVLQNVFDKLGLSARSYNRIVKVARTIADLDGSDIIRKPHILAAAQYRTLDRNFSK